MFHVKHWKGGFMNGGYQTLNLKGATVGDPVTIKGAYDTVKNSNGKTILVNTNDGQDVFAQAKEVGGDYYIAYTSAEGKLIEVVIEDDDKVTTTISDSGASVETLTQTVNEISARENTDTLEFPPVLLNDYTGDNTYTCPSDGYVRLAGDGSNAVAGIEVKVSSGIWQELGVSFNLGPVMSIYVKKGMEIRNSTRSTATSQIWFLPLV